MVGATGVSVVMCTHNGVEFVREQVRSILEQTVLPGELVVSDDASTDGTIEVVREAFVAASMANPDVEKVQLHVHRNEPALGVTKNFETAIAISRGSIILLADQDDVWFPNKVEVLLSEVSSNEGASFVFGDATLITHEGLDVGHSLFETLAISKRELKGITGRDPYEVLARRNIVTGATVAFSRLIYDRATPFPPGWVHDEWLATVAALAGANIAVTRSLTRYRQHSSNQIGVQKRTTSIRIGRLTMNGRERNARLRERSQQLLERAGALAVGEHDKKLIRTSLKFQDARSRFPRFRGIRWVLVLPQVLLGRYWRVSNGTRDVLRDLVQPL